MVNAIIFDMDGGLIDSIKAWYHIFNLALKEFEGKEVSREEFESDVWAQDFNKTARRYFNVDASVIREFFNDVYDEFNKNLKLFGDTDAVLFSLREKGIKLAVATNTNVKQATKVLKDIKLFGYFDCVLGGDSVPNGKPEPDILFESLRLLKLDKNEVLFVGDTVWDKLASEKAGVKFVGLGIEGDEKISELSGLLELI